MTSLQEKSNQMNTSLSNRKKLQSMLNSFIDSAVLDKELIETICLGEINDHYVNSIQTLLKKLSTCALTKAT
jgi:F0F1-type ATP synthase delta subunit